MQTHFTARKQLAFGLFLAVMLGITRGQHIATLHALPDIAWAAFFLAGLYLRATWILSALLIEVALLDGLVLLSSAAGGCFTAAYALLLPAYGSLWLAGRGFNRNHGSSWSLLFSLSGWLIAGTLTCELFSSGGYYFLSGKFSPSLMEFAERLALYYPADLSYAAFYVVLIVLIHSVWQLTMRSPSTNAIASNP